ncbi:phosphodiesterase [Vibrio sp. SS-MA-C1-2]|uniref:phosphodiesterase n=1 Tax=Vibrio sp. SS-MA-C1-2 TaxID=2908646 RepID=UPI001F272DCF|nr:phosphodiesterase [Vibrio sp. SS-MA-C1-2]UJF18786.1 phosphodiesterase [Vibrio sp. SS-MA-C1-2]
MDLFFASDLHGSLSVTEQIIDRYRKSGATRLILLGDLLNHGPRNSIPEGYEPAKVAELLNLYKNEIIAIRGNCDSEVDQMLLDFPILNDAHSLLLANGTRLFLTHGHINNPDKQPPLMNGDGLVYGHTHIPVAEWREGKVIFNPGSPTFPKGGYPASYGILKDNELHVVALSGEVVKSVSLY